MQRDSDITSDMLDRPDWNSLKQNYSKHDIGEAYFTGRMNQLGYDVENWGIDMRDDGGEDGVIFDNKMDLRMWDDDTLVGICDIKTKSSMSWMGKFNLRHLAHYAHWADEYDVPVFVYFTIVDVDEETVGDTNIVLPIEPWDGYEEYVRHYTREGDDEYYYIETTGIEDECPYVQRSFGAQDDNIVVVTDDEYYKGFEWVEARLREQQ